MRTEVDVISAGDFVVAELASNARATPSRIVVLAAIGCFGCSFVFVTGPPSEPPDDPREPTPECTTGVLFPVGDGAVATIGGSIVVASATRDQDEAIVEPETIAVSAALVTAFA